MFSRDGYLKAISDSKVVISQKSSAIFDQPVGDSSNLTPLIVDACYNIALMFIRERYLKATSCKLNPKHTGSNPIPNSSTSKLFRMLLRLIIIV